jgi:hypothetical protein
MAFNSIHDIIGTRASEFLMGQWVRSSDARMRGVCRVESLDHQGNVFVRRLDGSAAFWNLESELVEWEPAAGERIRVVSGERRGNVYPYVRRGAAGHDLQSGFVFVRVPLDTKFEPVFEEPKPTALSILGRAAPDVLDIEFYSDGETIGVRRAPLVGDLPKLVPTGTVTAAREFPRALVRFPESASGRIVTGHAGLTERTEPPREPLPARNRRKVEELGVMLRESWGGRKDRK